MPEKTSRRTFLAAAGTGTVAALAGCGGDGGDEGDDPTTDDGGDGTTSEGGNTEGGTLQLAAPGPIQTLDPANAKGSGAGYDQYNQTLFDFDNGEYPPVAKLAEDYEVSDDSLTYTVQLRQGIQFHDGQELTAQDVVYSWERLAGSDNSRNKDDIIGETMTIDHEKEEVPEGEDQTLDDYINGSLAVEAVDDYTFEFTLRRPFLFTLFQISGGAFAVIPEGSVQEDSVEREGIDTDGEYSYNEFFSTGGGDPLFAGLGPFQVDTWNKGSDIQLSAFEDYFEGPPALDGITYTIITNPQTRLQRFRGGNLDILESIPTATFNPDNVSVDNTRGVIEEGTYTDQGTDYNFGRIPTLSTEYIVFNCTRVPRVVRRAFALLLNQDRVLRDAYKGVGKAAYHITPPAPYPTFEEGVGSEESYDRHAEEGYMSQTEFGADGYPWGYGETRIDEARQIMEDAGYGPDNQFSITATNISGNSAYQNVFTTLQEKGRQAHINMEITEADFGVIITQAVNGEMDMFALGDGMEYPSASNFLRFLHAGNPGTAFTRWGQNYLNEEEAGDPIYSTPEYARTADEAWQTGYLENGFGNDEESTQSRFRAWNVIEEMNWASVQELPTVHAADQRLWQQDVDLDMYGVMENQTFYDVTKGNDS